MLSTFFKLQNQQWYVKVFLGIFKNLNSHGNLLKSASQKDFVWS